VEPSSEYRRTILAVKFYTHHPFQTVETSHLSGGVHWGHAVFGPDVQRTTCLEHEEFEYFQVSLLCGQINRRDVVVHLSVRAATKYIRFISISYKLSMDHTNTGYDSTHILRYRIRIRTRDTRRQYGKQSSNRLHNIIFNFLYSQNNLLVLGKEALKRTKTYNVITYYCTAYSEETRKRMTNLLCDQVFECSWYINTRNRLISYFHVYTVLHVYIYVHCTALCAYAACI